MIRSAAAIALAVLLAVPVSPQELPADAAGKVLLKEGSEVHLKFSESISSKTATTDDRVNLELEKDLKIGKANVAKAGYKAVASVTNAKKAGSMGKAGELNIRLEYMNVNATRVRLRASKGKEGEGKQGTAIALTVLFGPLGLLKKGKDVEIKAGQSLLAYVDEDVWLPLLD